MNGKKFLVTGASGMLGSCLIEKLKQYDVVGIGSEIDITSHAVLSEFLENEKPNVIIHAAAYTNVDECERNSDKAYAVNVIGTQNLVNYCTDKNCFFVYLSSTGVYEDSKDERYTEFCEVRPTTVHHKSKYEGEKVVVNHLNRYLIIRTGWLYGGSIAHAKNFVYKRYLEAKDRQSICADVNQIGNPTYVNDLVDQIVLLLEENMMGLFNCVNNAENITRYEYVRKIVELFELNCEVKKSLTNQFKRLSPISKNESAINYKLELMGCNIMGEWEASLSKYINRIKTSLYE